jgi:hypothetical protein
VANNEKMYNNFSALELEIYQLLESGAAITLVGLVKN